VFAAQFVLLAATRRWVPLAAALALGGLLAAVLPALPGVRFRWDDGVHPARGMAVLLAYPPVLLASMLWGSLVWRGERPRSRDAHRVLPVDQGTHELLRVAAGAAWLLPGVAALVLFLAAASGAEGRGLLLPWLAIVYLTGSLTGYLLTSALALRVRRPLAWLALGLAVWAAAVAALQRGGFARASALLAGVFQGRAGLWAALGGGFDVTGAGGTPRLAGDPGRWALAMLLWLASSLLLVAAAATPRRERRAPGSTHPRRWRALPDQALPPLRGRRGPPSP
jgi:hypothetical protein